MNTEKAVELPFYAKASLIVIGLSGLLALLYLVQHILVPVIYAFLIAIMINPLVRFLVNRRLNRVLAIFISLMVAVATAVLVLMFLSTQISSFIEAFPKVIDKFSAIAHQGVLWVSDHFNISTQKVNAFVDDTKTEILKNGKSQLGQTLAGMGDALIITLLIPVYVFMILFYQPLLVGFLRKIFGNGNTHKVNEVLTSIRYTTQRYLLALLLEAIIIATLNSLTFMFIGIEFAIVLGVIGALVNIIPYIGALIGLIPPVLVAFATKSSSSALWVLVLYVAIQIFDNYFLIPKVVASKIKINALISILFVLISTALWGIPGMFLAIPLVAISKVICDHIESLKPLGYLLGDAMPAITLFKRRNGA